MSDILLKSMHFPSLDARYIVGDETMSTEGAAADAKATGDALETKADKTDTYTKAQVDDKVDDAKSELEEAIDDLDERKAEIDGYYETFTSGQTNQLIATEAITDTEPYNYRKTGGANDVGDRVYDTLVGGSVVWNQLIKNGNFDSNSDWTAQGAGTTVSISNNKLTLTVGTAAYSGIANTRTDQPAIEGHKHLLTATLMSDTTFTNCCDFAMHTGTAQQESGYFTLTANTRTTVSKIMSVNSSLAAGNRAIQYQLWVPHANAVEGATVEVSKVSAINLTAAVTPLIADYIYTLETANAGDGVAWFKKYFPGIYYGYAEPHFEHVQTSAKCTVGFNQWDEEWELGTILPATGEIYPSTSKIRSKGFIPALPNTSYCISKQTARTSSANDYVWLYNESEAFISCIPLVGFDTNMYYVFQTTADTRYIRFIMADTTYKNDICINFHGDRDGEYEPYRKRTYPLDSSLTLRGVPKLDSANRLYFDGDIYEHDGTVTRRFAYAEFDGSQDEPWELIGSSVRNIFRINTLVPNKAGADFITNGMTVSATSESASADDNIITCRTTSYVSKYLYVFTPPSMIADISAFRSWLASHPLKMVYPINEPTTETAEPFQSPMVVDPLGTEEFIDYGVEEGTRDVSIVVGHSSEYPADLRGKLQRLPSPTGTNGDYVITEVDGKLYLKPYVPAVGLTMTAPTPTEGEGE